MRSKVCRCAPAGRRPAPRIVIALLDSRRRYAEMVSSGMRLLSAPGAVAGSRSEVPAWDLGAY